MISDGLLQSEKFQNAMKCKLRRDKISLFNAGKTISIVQKHKVSETNGHCIELIPPNKSYIKEHIIDNCLSAACAMVRISPSILKRYANTEIKQYHNYELTDSIINTIGWTLIDNNRQSRIIKNKKYKIYEVIKPDGSIDTPIQFQKYCKQIDANADIFIRLSGYKIRYSDLTRLDNNTMTNFINWKCNIYEIDESNPDNITKTLIINKSYIQKPYKIYEVIKLNGQIDEIFDINGYCNRLGINPMLFKNNSGHVLTKELVNHCNINTKKFIGWQCNVYKINESDPNNIIKTLIHVPNKRKPYKTYEIINPNGELVKTRNIQEYCKQIGANSNLFIKTTGRKITYADVKHCHAKTKIFVGWQCNVYEINAAIPNTIIKTLYVDKPKFIFPKVIS
jgi:hypothetical protein